MSSSAAHSGSFIADELLEHGRGTIDCVLKGEGELSTQLLLKAIPKREVETVPGAVTRGRQGPAPVLLENLDLYQPARDLLRRRRKYFIGELDPCASIEFTRGCPWDCAFCSAWTFYGRSYRSATPERIGEELASIREPMSSSSMTSPSSIPSTASPSAARWSGGTFRSASTRDPRRRAAEEPGGLRLLAQARALRYLFLGLEAIDAEGLKLHRKRVSMGTNNEALEVARSIGVKVAINLIADPSWDKERFAVVREWAMSIPVLVHLTVATPYPAPNCG